jgi:hypothetical protein
MEVAKMPVLSPVFSHKAVEPSLTNAEAPTLAGYGQQAAGLGSFPYYTKRPVISLHPKYLSPQELAQNLLLVFFQTKP